MRVSVLFSEPKIPQFVHTDARTPERTDVSVLFSEPKIPQSAALPLPKRANQKFQCSSASRKFLNLTVNPQHIAQTRFQCSSASRKFLNTGTERGVHSDLSVSVLFSEPKIPQSHALIERRADPTLFQCSSASRKFLNVWTSSSSGRSGSRFSALQRAENSSIDAARGASLRLASVSVLFSEPKIPQ